MQVRIQGNMGESKNYDTGPSNSRLQIKKSNVLREIMYKFHNLPAKFKVQSLASFTFGMPDGKDDPILEKCALRISPIAEFLDENKSILVADRGTGKTAVFRLLSEGALRFSNPEKLSQLYVPIDEDLSYKTLRDHITAHREKRGRIALAFPPPTAGFTPLPA